MKPLGVHVTIVEPGGLRTDFAGSSTRIAEGSPAYAETVGQVAAMQRAYDGKQPGDPDRAARAMMAVTSAKTSPLRLCWVATPTPGPRRPTRPGWPNYVPGAS